MKCLVETHSELTNHRNVATRRHGLHGSLSVGLSNGVQIVDQFILRHADARILDCNRRVRLVGEDFDEESAIGS